MQKEYNTNTDLASLISSRICHDLVNPIGAIGNGLELLELQGVEQSEELKLISDSVQNANARINFFRMAFGPCSTNQISGEKIQRTLGDAYASSKCRLDWQAGGDFLHHDVKLNFLLIQCLENTLPLGGLITIQKVDNSWVFCASGKRTKHRADLWGHLTNQSETVEISPADIHFEIARKAIEKNGHTIKADFGDTAVVVNLSLSDQP